MNLEISLIFACHQIQTVWRKRMFRVLVILKPVSKAGMSMWKFVSIWAIGAKMERSCHTQNSFFSGLKVLF
ncbi:MAG: hypothetical protein OEV24_13625 [Cyclobacteriaceae bacterium]|nr:hypothetical protein [Cyclobacteriaceae bacterium]